MPTQDEQLDAVIDDLLTLQRGSRARAKSALQRMLVEAREPLVHILEKSGYQKCIECKDYYHDDDMVFCEVCDSLNEDSGMHEWCAGHTYDGDGEYPSENAYALCKKHSERAEQQLQPKQDKETQ